MDLEALSVADKCRLLGGASSWRTHGVAHAGLPVLKMSDGPNGVRGDGIETHGTPGVAVPVGIALGSTWDPGLVEQVGELLGREAVRKAAHVLLGPTINLHRVPTGGRVFECLSEDPELTGVLAAAFVHGVQSHGVATTPKHFVGNDTEVDRFTVDVRIDERTLRELYLRPFEIVVTEARPWGIMSAYNQLGGTHCSQHAWLLQELLRGEWGFDGFVVSDWYGFHDTAASVRAGLTVPMPGPDTCYGDRLLAAVEAGEVTEHEVDRLVADLVRLVERTRATERAADRPEQAVDDPGERALARRAAIAGTVLLTNDGTLPLQAGTPDAPLRVAVLGPNAADTRTMGGGSSSLTPLPAPSILEALAARPGLQVTHEAAVSIDIMAPPPTSRELRTPDGTPGVLVEYRGGSAPDGPVLHREIAESTFLRWFGSTPAGVDPDHFNVTVRGSYVPARSGPHAVSAVLTGACVARFGGVDVLVDDGTGPRSELFFGVGSLEHRAVLELEAGVPVPVELWLVGRGGFAAIRFGVEEPQDAGRLDRAAAMAAEADVAVVVVGTNDEWETEGNDRDGIELPGAQDELVRRVAAVAPRTVVIVNAGSPVAMPWADEVGAIALPWFGGQEMGEAVADVLLGVSDPGGRLPITVPVRLLDVPAAANHAPVDGVQRYAEGRRVGYRGLLADGVAPRFAFGHGLSYGEAVWSDARLRAATIEAGQDATASLTVTATADRDATVVVQAYLRRPDVGPGDPPLELAGFTKVVVAAGTSTEVEVRLPARAFRRWDTSTASWVVDPGAWTVVLGRSAVDEHDRLDLTVR